MNELKHEFVYTHRRLSEQTNNDQTHTDIYTYLIRTSGVFIYIIHISQSPNLNEIGRKKIHSFAGILIISHTTTIKKKNRGINRIKMYTTQLCSKRVTCNNVQMACNVRHTNRFRNTQQPHANRMMTAW